MNVLIDLPIGLAWSMGQVGWHILMCLDELIPDRLYCDFWQESDPALVKKYRYYQVDPPEGEDTAWVRYAHPDSCGSMNAAKNIGYFVVEESKVSKERVKICNKLDLILCPSQFCIDTFRSNGVKTRMQLMPHGLKMEWFPYMRREFSEPFTFLHLAELQLRKNTSMVISCFLKLFKGNKKVKLVLKNIGTYESFAEYNREPNIEVIEEKWPYRKLVELYHNCHVFLMPSSGEGFGLTGLESLVTGTPSILSGWSGDREYATGHAVTLEKFTVENAFGVDYRGTWRKPDPDELADKMLDMYKNYKPLEYEDIADLRLRYNYMEVYKLLTTLYED